MLSQERTANRSAQPDPNNLGLGGQSTAGTTQPLRDGGSGWPSEPSRVGSLLPATPQEVRRGLCISRVLREWAPRAFGCSGLLYVLWCPWGPNWSPWGRGPCTQHGDHGQGEEQEARSPTWFGEWHHTGEVTPGWPQRAAERTSSVKASTGPLNWANHAYALGPPPPTTCPPFLWVSRKPAAAGAPVAPRGQGRPRVCPPQDILAERWEGVLLVVPKDFKYNRLALDVFNEGLRHLHSDLEEKELSMVQFTWEKDAASNSTREVGGASLSDPPHLSLIPFCVTQECSPHQDCCHEIPAFSGGGQQLLVFPPHIHLV